MNEINEIMNYLMYYIIIGVLWSLYCESTIRSNGHRIRLIFLWPFTVLAFIIGFIQAMKDNEEM